MKQLGQTPHTFAFNSTLSGADERSVAFDEGALALHVMRPLSELVVDLVEIIAAVHTADRLAKRPSSTRAGSSWSRDMRLQIGVRVVGHWRQPEILESIGSILQWLTDDRWELDFVGRQAPPRSAESVQFLFEQPASGDAVALFSGGLDSVAGIVADISAGFKPIALTVGANGRMVGRQRAVLDAVNGPLAQQIQAIPVNLHLHGVQGVEQSQRARGFAFLGLAGAAADALGIRDVHVFENGIGSVNLPYTAAQTGAHCTRSMHPVTLAQMEEFLAMALQMELKLSNPSQFKTKAEMCRRLEPEFWPAVSASRSCDTAFASRTSVAESCGLCTSCILRRQSLYGAGLSNLDARDEYRFDILSADTRSGDRFYPLRAMALQARKFADATATADPARSLVKTFPELAVWIGSHDAESRPALSRRVTALFGTYADEWQSFPSAAVQQLLSLPSSRESQLSETISEVS